MDKIDLHNDLLNYLLADAARTPRDDGLECSIPKMIAGGIRVQVLAAFSLTPTDPRGLERQFHDFQTLRKKSKFRSEQIQFLWAIEDAQQLLGESALGVSIPAKLNHFAQGGCAPAYVSLTWMHANEFGGGDRTSIGISPKGKELLDILSDMNVSVDLSHASDALARDIIEYREQSNHTNGVLISHTCFRGVHNVPRNVSDDVARYVASKDGLIGLSFSKRQLGIAKELNVRAHYEYAVSLHEEFRDVLCLGGDLYHEADVPAAYRSGESSFYPELATSADYQNLNNFDRSFLYGNAFDYLVRHGALAPNTMPRA